MSLYVIRHAHAVDAAEDPARPLSPRGRQQVRVLADFLGRSRSLMAREVWHSPLARSRETAALLVGHLGLEARLAQVDGLDCEDDPAIMAERLRDRTEPLAIVGHEPHLSALLTLLVAGPGQPPRFLLKKCAAVALDRVADGWVVRWHVSPEILGE